MKYYIYVFGCQMNQSDAERLAGVLEKIGYQKTSSLNEANLVCVVMCSVRQSAVDRVHWLTHKFKSTTTHSSVVVKKNKPVTVLTGCVLKKDKKTFEQSFDYVLDIKDITKLPALLSRYPSPLSSPRKRGSRVSAQTLDSHFRGNDTNGDYLEIIPKYSKKNSANLPIMTGCNNFCSYCVVPNTRGREISRTAEEIICEVKKLAASGCKNIWLLGQNVNSYKYKSYSNVLKNTRIVNFPKLLKMVNDVPGDFVINFTSSHPKDFSDELIKTLAKCQKFSKRLNLPIQSGDDKILKKMNRPYTVLQYKKLVKKIRKAIPDILLSTDVIVGFPGETKKQFQNTVRLLKEIKFGVAFINKYSPRAGTAAAKLKDNVPWAEKKRREKILIELINK